MRVVVEELNFKDEFSEGFWSSWNYLSNMIRFKEANESISSRKKSADN